MPGAERLVVIASHLRPEEAGMLRGLLQSAGILAVVRDEMLSSVNPFIQLAIGGAKLVVPAADELRAREIVKSAGVFPGSPHDEPVEIPEEEWAAAPDAEPVVVSPRPPWMRRAVTIAPFLVALFFALWRCGLGA